MEEVQRTVRGLVKLLGRNGEMKNMDVGLTSRGEEIGGAMGEGMSFGGRWVRAVPYLIVNTNMKGWREERRWQW